MSVTPRSPGFNVSYTMNTGPARRSSPSTHERMPCHRSVTSPRTVCAPASG